MDSGHPAANGDFHNSEAQNPRNSYSLTGINGDTYGANFGQSNNSTPSNQPSEYYFPESFNNPPTTWSFNDPSGSTPAPSGLPSMDQYSNLVPNNFMNPSVALLDPQYFFSGSTGLSQGLNSNHLLNSMQFRPQFAPYSLSSISPGKNFPTTTLNSQTLSRLQTASHNRPFQPNFQDAESQVPGLAQKQLLQQAQAQAQASQLANQRLGNSNPFGNGFPQPFGNNQRTFSTSSHDSLQLPTRTNGSLENNDSANFQKRGCSTEDNELDKGLDGSIHTSKLFSQGIINETSQELYPNTEPGTEPGNIHQLNDCSFSNANSDYVDPNRLRQTNSTNNNFQLMNKDSSQNYSYQTSNNPPKVASKVASQVASQDASQDTSQDTSQDPLLTQPNSTQDTQAPITSIEKLELLRKKSLENRQDFFKILETVSVGKIDYKSVQCFDQPVDLYILWTEVITRGGIVGCGKVKGWGAVRESLGLDAAQGKVPARLKSLWKKYLQGLESALFPDQFPNPYGKRQKTTHPNLPSDSQQPECTPNLDPVPSSTVSLNIKPPAISNPLANTSTSSHEVNQPPPAKPKVVKPVKVIHPPRTAPYDYIPFFRKVDSFGGIDVSSFQALTGTDYGMLTGEIRIYDITMALQSRLPSCVSQALFVLVHLSYDATVSLVLSQCQHLTQTLILLLLEDFETLSETSSETASETASESNPANLSSTDPLTIFLHRDLCRQFTDEALYLPDFKRDPKLFSFNPSQRAALVCLILSNLSFVPANQPFLAEQIDLLIIMFRFSHTSFLNSLGEMIAIRKYLLVLLSNILEFWRIDFQSITLQFDNKLLFSWVMDLCCEFLDQTLPLYPSLAWECLVKITTLDAHRDLLTTSRFTVSCTKIVNHLSNHLQRFVSRLDEDPFDEANLVYLQYILMAAPHFIKAASTLPRGLSVALSGIVSWLIHTEISERQSRHFKQKPSFSRLVNSQAEDREALLVGLIVRGLLSMQAVCQTNSTSLDCGSMLSHQSTLIDLLTLPMLHPHVANQINLLLQPVVELMNQSPSRNQSFKNEVCQK